MRLPDVDRGDTVRSRALIRFISVITGMRLPDAARVAFYHPGFVGPALGAWTQAVMRGPSGWTVAERELMAAMVARWNSCAFCVGAHRAIAIRGLDPAVVDACLADHRTAPLAPALRATLSFLEKLTAVPDELGADDAREALAAGVTPAQLADASAVAAVFGIITRYADALGFALPTQREFEKSAAMMLRRGYA